MTHHLFAVRYGSKGIGKRAARDTHILLAGQTRTLCRAVGVECLESPLPHEHPVDPTCPTCLHRSRQWWRPEQEPTHTDTRGNP